ncbi:PAS domain-containing protein, partial [Streptomyces thermocarboxydovorans]|uniref:PAS domain-containing protein n=1 Tax=Streptomyces thermocarboxydovorans TaxID=59298 RepID=UPI0031D42080
MTGWSEGARRLLGYGAEEVVGRSTAGLLAEGFTTAKPASPADRQSWSGELVLRHQDGHCVEVNLLAHRRSSENGVDWLLIWAPTPRPYPREADEMVHWGYAQSPCILAIYDTELRSVRANADMERAVALTDAQMRGLTMSEIVPDNWEAEKIERGMRDVLRTGERLDLECFLRVPGESREHAWSVSLAPLRDGSRMCGVCFAARDTTSRYEARQRLLLVNEVGSRIGSTLDMEHTAQELADVTVPRLADFVSVDLLADLADGDEPPSGPLTGPVPLRRVAQ